MGGGGKAAKLNRVMLMTMMKRPFRVYSSRLHPAESITTCGTKRDHIRWIPPQNKRPTGPNPPESVYRENRKNYMRN